MTTISTKLIRDGNSTAVRLPKLALEMSGLTGNVQLDVRKGQIIILKSQDNPRAGWKEAIKKEIATNGPMTYKDDYGDLLEEAEGLVAEGLDTD